MLSLTLSPTDRIWSLTFSNIYSTTFDERILILQLGEHNFPAWVDAKLIVTDEPRVPIAGEKSSITIPLECYWRQLKPSPTRTVRGYLSQSVAARYVLCGDPVDGHSSYSNGLASYQVLTRPVPSTRALRLSS